MVSNLSHPVLKSWEFLLLHTATQAIELAQVIPAPTVMKLKTSKLGRNGDSTILNMTIVTSHSTTKPGRMFTAAISACPMRSFPMLSRLRESHFGFPYANGDGNSPGSGAREWGIAGVSMEISDPGGVLSLLSSIKPVSCLGAQDSMAIMTWTCSKSAIPAEVPP